MKKKPSTASFGTVGLPLPSSFGASPLSAGISFKGEHNERAMQRFKKHDVATTLGELTDYESLESYGVTVTGAQEEEKIENWDMFEDDIKGNILKAGFDHPTPIQKYCIPLFISRRSFIAVSPTGSGKTLAYALPLIKLFKGLPVHLHCLVLVHTRELAAQIHRQFRAMTEGLDVKVKLARKHRDFPNAHIVVGTPKRLLMFEDRVKDAEYVILDEADCLLSHSFVKQTDQLLSLVPKGAYFALFSATVPPKVEEAARSFIVNPIKVQVGDSHMVTGRIHQELKFVGTEKGKVVELRQRINAGEIHLPAIVFVSNRQRAKELSHEIGVPCAVLTSDQNDKERAAAIKRFRSDKAHFLITTDLGGRGIDLVTIKTVVNFDLPPNSITYVHRIGRTARAGREGYALTLFTTEDQQSLKPVASVMKKNGFPVEDWMLVDPPRSQRGARALYEPIKRKSVSTALWNRKKPRMPK